MTESKIIRMANQIASFFETKSEDKAIEGIAEHINKFWERRMRQEFFALIENAKNEFHPLVVKAAPHIRPVE